VGTQTAENEPPGWIGAVAIAVQLWPDAGAVSISIVLPAAVAGAVPLIVSGCRVVPEPATVIVIPSPLAVKAAANFTTGAGAAVEPVDVVVVVEEPLPPLVPIPVALWDLCSKRVSAVALAGRAARAQASGASASRRRERRIVATRPVVKAVRLSGGSWCLRGELTGSRSRATDSRSIGFAPAAPGKAPQLVPPPAVR
jgi:hypothetical protein